MPNYCSKPNCKKIPTFNFHCETKGLYCSEHKLYLMNGS